jgi:acyl transferase domain-containing protein/acyl carrier protein
LSKPATEATEESVRAWLLQRIAEVVGIPAAQLDARAPLGPYGLDSRRITELMSELSEYLGHPLSPTLAWACSNIEALARRVSQKEESAILDMADREAAEEDPIALIGLSCRFPGAPHPASFWQLLRQGIDASAEIPRARWRNDRVYSPDPAAPGKAITDRAALLDEAEIQRFDPLFFGISPREAEELDPQQRLALQLVWEALEYAGIPPRQLAGSATGVFLGSMWHQWADYTSADPLGMSAHRATGQANNMIANRVSYVYGLLGPSLVVDTACSSSLVAVHLACASLRAGESTLALAGGVNLILLPNTTVALSKFGGLAADGRSKAFAASADGYGRGEGGGVVVLKRLSRAVVDGDPILAVIRGSAVNNNGHGLSLTAPQGQLQEALLRTAYRRAGVPAERVHYVEAHGTGTRLGDPIEAGALGAVLGSGRPPDPTRALRIGSVKTNIGHLEGAAGIAGLIKTVLAMQQRQIPPSLHFHEPSPLIPFSQLGLRVVSELEPWPAPTETPVAGVSSFGWGGTNAHVVLEGPLTAPPRPPAPPRPIDAAPPVEGTRPKLVMVCSPHGGQWSGMARRLLATAPAFRAAFTRCERALRPHLGWSVIDRLFTNEAVSRVHEVDVAQPLLFAIAVALAAQWRALGITPDAVVGHCLGEVVAAHLAGVLDLEAAARTLYHYSQAQFRCRARGGMAVVDLPPSEVAALLAEQPPGLSIAGLNSPRSTTVAGEPHALAALLAHLKARGVLCGAVRINSAPHTPQMDAVAAELEQALHDLRPQRAAIPLYSTVTGQPLGGPEMDGAYFARNLRSPVKLQAATEQLLADGYAVFLELSPHPVLGASLQQTIAAAGASSSALALPSLRRDADEPATLAAAYRELCQLGLGDAPTSVDPGEEPAQLLVLSARCPAALRERAQATATYLRDKPTDRTVDLCYTAARRREPGAHRLAVVGCSPRQLADELLARAQSASPPAGSAPRIVFVFPGQGAQWLGMGRALLASEPCFRATVEQCERALAPFVDFSLLAELQAPPHASRLTELAVVQPVLWAMQVALAAQLGAWGITPDAVVGHSMGEVAAACVSGALDLAAGARVIARRSQLVQRHKSGEGGMALVELSLAEADALLAAHRQHLSVAASNGPRSVVLAGDATALDAVLATLQQRDVFCRPIKVDYASHSPQMDALLPPLREALEGLAPRPPTVPFFSTVTASWLGTAPLDAPYWATNLRAPVQFAESVQALRRAGHDLFVEISPHPVLLPALTDTLEDLGLGGVAVATLRREEDERACLLQVLGALYTHGAAPDFARLYPHGEVLPLPTYPFQRQRYWPQLPAASRAVPSPLDERPRPAGDHPLLGAPFTSPAQPHTYFWELALDLGELPFLADHQVDGSVLFPATAYLELALSAARRVCGSDAAPVLNDVAFVAGLYLRADGGRRLQLVLVDQRQGPTPQLTFQIFARVGDDPLAASAWQLHAGGALTLPPPAAAPQAEAPDWLPHGTPRPFDSAAFYQALAGWGLHYGPAFQGLVELRVGERDAVGRLLPPAGPPRRDYSFDPAWLDAALHALLALVMARAPQGPFVPVHLEQLRIHVPTPLPGGAVFAHARLREREGDGTPQEPDGSTPLGDVRLLSADGQVLIEALGLRLRRKPREAAAAEGELWMRAWQKAPPASARAAEPDPAVREHGRWLILGDHGGPEGRGALAVQLQALLQQQGDEVALIPAEQQAETELLAAVLARAAADGRPCRGIVHLGSLDVPAPADDDDACAATLARGCGPALRLLQALPRARWRDLPPVWLVTRRAQYVADAERAPDGGDAPWQAPLWGLGQTLLYEHPELRCTLVDLGLATADAEAAALRDELLAAPRDGEHQIARRDSGRYVARLVPAATPIAERRASAPGASPGISQGTYLISGGLGALGLAVAQWLVDQGARSLLLLGRRGVQTAEQREALDRLRAAGAQVVAAAVDVADRPALTRAVHAAVAPSGGPLPPLAGVIHAAGVLDDALLGQQDDERFLRALRPKAQGAWNLHLLTRELPLDSFILYSSFVSLIGSPGQSNYAAANAFLDALAHHRRARGLPALCLNWGPFADVGLAAAEDRGARLAQRGLGQLTLERGHQALGRLLATDAIQVGVAPFDGAQWAEFYPAVAASALFAEVLAAAPRGAPAASAELLRDVAAATPGERQRLLEQVVTTHAGKVLRVAPTDIHRDTNLTRLGLDSLTGLELRNRLERDLGLRLPSALLWTYPRVDALAAHLLQQLGLAAAPAPRPSPPAAPEEPALHLLSDEALLAVLEQELVAGEGA